MGRIPNLRAETHVNILCSQFTSVLLLYISVLLWDSTKTSKLDSAGLGQKVSGIQY